MCGICGWLTLDGSPVDLEIVSGMMRRLVHRGPDDDGLYHDAECALGLRRLAIIDLVGGHQPLANEDGTVWVSFNGEIYNFRELMQELTGAGHRFSTRADTEVLVHAYEQYGLDFLSRLNGMFAFALWDQRLGRLVLARDPFGIKPLYFWSDRRHLLFASELRAFLADPCFPRAVDPRALDDFLTFQFVPSPNTILRGVHKLRPGHCLVIENGATREIAFTRQPPPMRVGVSSKVLVGELRERLQAAIRRQLVSDVPLGALLSGGLDSATVVALMQQVRGDRLKTFTIGFEGDYAKNELEAARETSRILGTEHYETVLTAQECLADLETSIWDLDEPIATPSALPMHRLSQLAATQVKVVLTGQGADEPWAGYRRYRAERLGRWYRRLPRRVRQGLVVPLAGLLPRSEAVKRAAHAMGEEDPARRFAAIYGGVPQAMKSALYRNGLAEFASSEGDVGLLEYWRAPVADRDTLVQQLYVETRFSLADNFLIYGDKMSMAASLEARVPLLDVELMDFVESLPAESRLKGWAGHKHLYRQAIAAWLPRTILDRPKIGFATPIDEWFQGELSGYLRERLSAPGGACSHYFDLDCISRMVEAHVARSQDFSRPLYALLVFDIWHQRFFA
jgi:asparagine synthase (glutamine-hydrolysing)